MPRKQLEALGEALLDFTGMADLEVWLGNGGVGSRMWQMGMDVARHNPRNVNHRDYLRFGGVLGSEWNRAAY